MIIAGDLLQGTFTYRNNIFDKRSTLADPKFIWSILDTNCSNDKFSNIVEGHNYNFTIISLDQLYENIMKVGTAYFTFL